MKKFIRIFSIVVLVIVALMIVLPIIFKGKIIEKVKKEVNENIHAQFDFEDYGMSLFRNFPDFSLNVKGVTIVGLDEFDGDTLTSVPSFILTIDLFSVFSGDKYSIKKVHIRNAGVYLKVLENGMANYDIAIETEDEEESEESSFSLELKGVHVSNARIIYDDISLPVFVELKDMDFAMSGDLTASETNLDVKAEVYGFDLIYDGISYMKKARVGVESVIEANLAESVYAFNDAALHVNELFLAANGRVGMPDEGYDLDIQIKAAENSFKNFLSLIPALYLKDFEDIQTKGKLAFNGYVKGLYAENSLPAFDLDIKVDEGEFKYPDFPGAVKNVNIACNILNPDGVLDNTVVEVSDFHMELNENPLDADLLLKTMLSDPYILSNIKGILDLGGIKDFYPLPEGEELNGMLSIDLLLDGFLSSLENEQYEDFKAIGGINLKEMRYKSADIPVGVNIDNAQLDFSPQYLILESFNVRFGESDLSASGKIYNYLSYYFGDELLRGEFMASADLLNLNELMPETETDAEEQAETQDTMQLAVITVPGNIDFISRVKINKILYSKLEMNDVKGEMEVKDQRVLLKNLSMNALDGSMLVNGSYDTKMENSPLLDFKLDLTQVDIQKTYHAFTSFKYLAPVAKRTEGSFSTSLSYTARLDEHMMPVPASMSGSGDLETTDIVVAGLESMNLLADELQMEEFKRMMLEEVRVAFSFADGKVLTKPFDIKYKDITGKAEGSTSFDQHVNYIMQLNIPRKMFGESANSAIVRLQAEAGEKGANIDLGETVKVDVLIGGTISKPEIKVGLKDAMSDVVNNVKDQVDEAYQQKKKEIEGKAKAIEDSLKAEAEKKKKEEEEKLEEEAEKQKKKLEEEAKKKLNDLF